MGQKWIMYRLGVLQPPEARRSEFEAPTLRFLQFFDKITQSYDYTTIFV